MLCFENQSCLFETPRTVACQASLSMGFSRQEYWSGLPCLSKGYLPDPGIESRSPALQAEPRSAALCVDSLHLSHYRSPNNNAHNYPLIKCTLNIFYIGFNKNCLIFFQWEIYVFNVIFCIFFSQTQWNDYFLQNL